MFKKKKILAKAKRFRRDDEEEPTQETTPQLLAPDVGSTLISDAASSLENVIPSSVSLFSHSHTQHSQQEPKWSSGFRSKKTSAVSSSRIISKLSRKYDSEHTDEPIQQDKDSVEILSGDTAFDDEDMSVEASHVDTVDNSVSALYTGQSVSATRRAELQQNMLENDIDEELGIRNQQEMFDTEIDIGNDFSENEGSALDYPSLESKPNVQVFRPHARPVKVLSIEEQKATLEERILKLKKEKVEKQAYLESLLQKLSSSKQDVSQLLEQFQRMCSNDKIGLV